MFTFIVAAVVAIFSYHIGRMNGDRAARESMAKVRAAMSDSKVVVIPQAPVATAAPASTGVTSPKASQRTVRVTVRKAPAPVKAVATKSTKTTKNTKGSTKK